MTLYYVTTGTSLSQKSRCWFSEKELNSKPPKRDATLSDYDDKALISLLDDGVDIDTVERVFAQARKRSTVFSTPRSQEHEMTALRKEVREKLSENSDPEEALKNATELAEKCFDIDCWDIKKRQALPAELATLLTMNELFCGGFDNQDEIHFIGGESNRVEVLMLAGVLRHMSNKENICVPKDNIHASYERKMDPLDPDSFFRSMGDLWDTVRPSTDPPVHFVVTGGYNGVGISLAINIKSESTVFYYLHEESRVDASKQHGLVEMTVTDGKYAINA